MANHNIIWFVTCCLIWTSVEEILISKYFYNKQKKRTSVYNPWEFHKWYSPVWSSKEQNFRCNRRDDAMPKLFDYRLEPKQTLHCNLNSSHTSSHTCTPLLLPNPEIPSHCSRRRRTVAAALPDQEHRSRRNNQERWFIKKSTKTRLIEGYLKLKTTRTTTRFAIGNLRFRDSTTCHRPKRFCFRASAVSVSKNVLSRIDLMRES